jgi:predicted Zn-dependent protease
MNVPRYTLLLISTILAVGCATTELAPVTTGVVEKEEDEKSLWTQSEKIADQIRSSGMVYDDEDLSAYLNSVARGLFPQEILDRIPFRITVVQDPRFNAFALPNGDMFLHSGILARMENEAQLATLLAHEMTHSTHRHSVRSLRDLKNKSAFFSVTILGGGDYGALLGNLGFMASVSGYSRDLERQADEEGLKLMVAAGYDPRESAKLFEYLKEEVVQEGVKEPFFFGTHPRLQERIDNYVEFIKAEYSGVRGKTNANLFLDKVKRLIYDNSGLDLRAGRFATPEDPAGYCLEGQIWQQKDPEDGRQAAIDAYQRALEIDPDWAEAHRGIGLIAFKAREDEKAAYHLIRYIELSPDATDRAYMEQYLDQIKKRGGGQ